MKSAFDEAFELVIGSEGGFQDDYGDSGNWTGGSVGAGLLKGTKYGISAASYPDLEIEEITLDDAKAIYKRDYWDKVQGDKLPYGISYAVFDYAVHSGVWKASASLQEVLTDVAVDGVIGPITLASLEDALEEDDFGPVGVIEEYIVAREEFLRTLSNWHLYGRGWINRLSIVEDDAIEMVESMEVIH